MPDDWYRLVGERGNIEQHLAVLSAPMVLTVDVEELELERKKHAKDPIMSRIISVSPYLLTGIEDRVSRIIDINENPDQHWLKILKNLQWKAAKHTYYQIVSQALGDLADYARLLIEVGALKINDDSKLQLTSPSEIRENRYMQGLRPEHFGEEFTGDFHPGLALQYYLPALFDETDDGIVPFTKTEEFTATMTLAERGAIGNKHLESLLATIKAAANLFEESVGESSDAAILLDQDDMPSISSLLMIEALGYMHSYTGFMGQQAFGLDEQFRIQPKSIEDCKHEWDDAVNPQYFLQEPEKFSTEKTSDSLTVRKFGPGEQRYLVLRPELKVFTQTLQFKAALYYAQLGAAGNNLMEDFLSRFKQGAQNFTLVLNDWLTSHDMGEHVIQPDNGQYSEQLLAEEAAIYVQQYGEFLNQWGVFNQQGHQLSVRSAEEIEEHFPDALDIKHFDTHPGANHNRVIPEVAYQRGPGDHRLFVGRYFHEPFVQTFQFRAAMELAGQASAFNQQLLGSVQNGAGALSSFLLTWEVDYINNCRRVEDAPAGGALALKKHLARLEQPE